MIDFKLLLKQTVYKGTIKTYLALLIKNAVHWRKVIETKCERFTGKKRLEKLDLKKSRKFKGSLLKSNWKTCKKGDTLSLVNKFSSF